MTHFLHCFKQFKNLLKTFFLEEARSVFSVRSYRQVEVYKFWGVRLRRMIFNTTTSKPLIASTAHLSVVHEVVGSTTTAKF